MTNEEVGQYIFLLIAAWLGGKDATLPDDLELLAVDARQKVSERVLEQFPIVETEWGPRRRNQTLYGEWMSAMLRSDEARKSVDKRWQNDRNTNVLPANELRNTIPNRTNPNQTKPDSISEISSPFNGQADFKNIAVRYSSYFGIHHSHSEKHRQKYFLACQKHGEQSVLNCFDQWAPSADWLRERRDKNGLNFFYKPLEELVLAEQMRHEREITEKKDSTDGMAEAIAADQENLRKEREAFEAQQKFLEATRDLI